MNFAQLIEAKSGAPPLLLDKERVHLALGFDVADMGSRGFDPSILTEHQQFNAQIDAFTEHPSFGSYLTGLTPRETYAASGVRVLSLATIQQEIQELAPGALLFPHGYLPFASSIGGNVVCFHAPTGKVVWANHDSFGRSEEIVYKDRATGVYESVPFIAENITRATIPLNDSFDAFLADLLSDRMKKVLDALD